VSRWHLRGWVPTARRWLREAPTAYRDESPQQARFPQAATKNHLNFGAKAPLSHHETRYPRIVRRSNLRGVPGGQLVAGRASTPPVNSPDIATAREALGARTHGVNGAFIYSSQLRTSPSPRPPLKKSTPFDFSSSSKTGIEQVLICVNPKSLDRLTRTRKFTHA
jgi:hypothetical protein